MIGWPGMNRLTPQPPRAYCEITGDTKVSSPVVLCASCSFQRGDRVSMGCAGCQPDSFPHMFIILWVSPCQKQPMQNRCFQRTAWALPLGIRWHLLLIPNLCCWERSFEISSFSLFRNVSESAAYYVITSETKPASGWEVIFLYL